MLTAEERRRARSASTRKWRQANPAAAKAASKRHYDKHTERCNARSRAYHKAKSVSIIERNRWYQRLRKFGLTKADFEAMLTSQGNACAGCGTDKPTRRGWQLDHCHKTGVIRGILCAKCNTGLGLADDCVTTLKRWITYLEATSSSTTA
jgi:hypothetical protein